MTDGNGVSSYQKNGDVTNGSNGSNGAPAARGGLFGGWKKWAAGAVLVAILATIYGVSSGSDPESTKKAIEKEMTASDLSFDKHGKLKLFDSFSKSLLCIAWLMTRPVHDGRNDEESLFLLPSQGQSRF